MKWTSPRLLLRQEKFYEDHAVDVLLNTRVTRIEPGARTATLSTGDRLGYDKLVLATGSRVARGQPARAAACPACTTCAPFRTWTASATTSTPARRW